MKQVVISAPLQVGIEEADRPTPGPGEVLVRATVTGISAGTEMGLYSGTNPDLVRRRWGEEWVYPMVPGYQCVGVVEACGPGVTTFRPGDRVMGNGKHAEYATIHTLRAVKLPPEVSDEAASLASLAGTALHGVRRADVEYGEVVAVVGLGVMGQLAIQHAKQAGAGRTIAVDLDPGRLEIARRLGADACIEVGREDPVERVRALTGIGADAVIEAAGVPAAVPLAMSLARDRGRVVIVGWHLKPVELALAEDFLYKELDLRATRSRGPRGDWPPDVIRWNADRTLRFVIDLLAAGRLRTDGLITHVLPYTEVRRAYELIRTRSEPSLHVALRWA